MPTRDKAWKVIRAYNVEASPTFTGFTSKPKAYLINDFEIIDQAALDSLRASGPNPGVQEAASKAGRQASGTALGKVVARIGEAPKHIGLQGYPSLEQAEAFLKLPLVTSAESRAEKAVKTTRSFIVVAAP
jgi:hypothetical protein